MMSMACGLAATGKVPFASTFAIFATGRAYDQIRLGIAHNELQDPDRREPRRRLAGRGRRLPPDDRGHRPDARDAKDAGDRPRRLQPGLRRDRDRLLRADEAPMYMRFGRPSTPIVYKEIPDDARQGRRRAARGQGHLDLRLRPHGLARAGGGRGPRARGWGRGRGRQRRDHQAARHRGRARVACQDRRCGHRRGAPASPAASPTRSARSRPSSTRCRSSPSAWATSSASPGPPRPAWSTSA